MCPSFCPTKTTNIFPLSCSCSALKVCPDAVESRRHAEDNIASPLLFSPKEFFLSLPAFFHSSIYFPLLYLYKKAQTTTFLIKLIKVLFSLSPIFLTFLGFEKHFTFWLFSSGFGKGNCRVWRGSHWLIFACDKELESCWCIQSFFWSCDTTLLIPLVDFYGCLL